MLQIGGTGGVGGTDPKGGYDNEESSKRIMFTYPMVKQTDMNEEMRGEVRTDIFKGIFSFRLMIVVDRT